MAKMFVLLSHCLTPKQKQDAYLRLHIEDIVLIKWDAWSSIPVECADISSYIKPLKAMIREQARAGDYILVQGDFGATIKIVQFSWDLGLIPLYATSTRKSVEKTIGDKVITTREFEHVRYRKY